MEACRMRVAASSLNVRSKPGVGNTRIGRLVHGAVVTVLDDMGGGWLFVRYGDGAEGYVDGSYLEAVPEEDEEQTAPEIVILDSEGNRFVPVGDFRVLIGAVD